MWLLNPAVLIALIPFTSKLVSAAALPNSDGVTSQAIERRDNTNVFIDISAPFNRNDVLASIDGFLKGTPASRRGGVQVAWMPWGKVPAPVKPRATKPHKDTDPVIRVSLKVHVNTPSWCLAVDGSIIYYIFLDNSEFRMKGVVDSWDTLTDLVSACSSSVNDQLRKMVPTKYDDVKNIVNEGLTLLTPNEHFGTYSFLPAWTGSVNDKGPVKLVLERDTIVSRWSDLCMDVQGGSTANGALIQQWECNETNAQKFDKTPVADGYFLIRNRGSGRCLAVSDAGTQNGALIGQYDCDSSNQNQHWRSTDPGGNSVGAKWLINRHSGKCVEVPGWATTKGTLLAQLDCVSGWKHFWYNV